MDEGDLRFRQIEAAKRLVQRGADAVNRLTQGGPVGVAVAKDKVRVAGEEPDRLGVIDVAAVQDQIHLPLLDQGKGRLHGAVAAVRVTERQQTKCPGLRQVAGTSN